MDYDNHPDANLRSSAPPQSGPPQYAALIEALSTGKENAVRSGDAMRERARFSPALSYGRHFGPPSPTAKPAAVMVHIERHRTTGTLRDWRIPLTVRPMHLSDHPGQISFPGGRLELGESHEEAAKREYCEELGVESFTGQIACELAPLNVYNSDYCVQPYISLEWTTRSYQPCTFEVERLIFLPLTDLLDLKKVVVHSFRRESVQWAAPAIGIGNDKIWGATAIILGELIAVLQASQFEAIYCARN